MAKDRGRWPGDLYVAGNLTADAMDIPAAAVGNAQIDSGDPIDAVKITQQHQREVKTNRGAAVTSFRQVIHAAFGPGDLVQLDAALTVACTGAATVTVDLLKNGVSVLSGPVLTLDNALAAYDFASPPGLLSTTYSADDVFEVNVTATAGGGVVGQGLVVRLVVREAAAP